MVEAVDVWDVALCSGIWVNTSRGVIGAYTCVLGGRDTAFVSMEGLEGLGDITTASTGFAAPLASAHRPHSPLGAPRLATTMHVCNAYGAFTTLR